MIKDMDQLGTIKMMLHMRHKLIVSPLVKSMMIYTLRLKTIRWELCLKVAILVCSHIQ